LIAAASSRRKLLCRGYGLISTTLTFQLQRSVTLEQFRWPSNGNAGCVADAIPFSAMLRQVRAFEDLCDPWRFISSFVRLFNNLMREFRGHD